MLTVPSQRVSVPTSEVLSDAFLVLLYMLKLLENFVMFSDPETQKPFHTDLWNLKYSPGFYYVEIGLCYVPEFVSSWDRVTIWNWSRWAQWVKLSTVARKKSLSVSLHTYSHHDSPSFGSWIEHGHGHGIFILATRTELTAQPLSLARHRQTWNISHGRLRLYTLTLCVLCGPRLCVGIHWSLKLVCASE